jgi:hypothetical protein
MARDVQDAQVPRRPRTAESGPDRVAARYVTGLLNRYRFSQIARLVDVRALQYSNVIRE